MRRLTDSLSAVRTSSCKCPVPQLLEMLSAQADAMTFWLFCDRYYLAEILYWLEVAKRAGRVMGQNG